MNKPEIVMKMKSINEIYSSKDAFELVFRSKDNILNEHKEDSSSEESDKVFEMDKRSSWPLDPPKGNVKRYTQPVEVIDHPESQLQNLLFDEQTVRQKFVRKVYMILMAQLCVTLAFLSLFVFNDDVSGFVYDNPALFWLAFIILFITMLIMLCFDDARRKTPINFVFLGIFTLAESFMLGIIASQFAPDEIFIAVTITAILCLALSLYAVQTKVDYTVMGGILLVCVLALLIFGIVVIIFPGRVMIMVYSCLGALLFSIYLVYDTQLMMGGKHKYSLNPEDGVKSIHFCSASNVNPKTTAPVMPNDIRTSSGAYLLAVTPTKKLSHIVNKSRQM
ncbi:hypothetical protein GQX74_007578 [Glossina fuscipes]|nr:hypothetical protein GQX74_007578 [Glossina fuscipes]